MRLGLEQFLKFKGVIGGIVFKRSFLIVSSFILIVAFQNCKSADLSSSGADQKLSSSEGSVDAPLISGQPLNSVTYYFSPSSGVNKTEVDLSQRPSSLQLDVNSGQIQVAGDSKKYCLSEDDISELKEILKQANLCRVKPKADQICAMIYKSPYAVMHFENGDVSLGEARSSCDRVDLCNAYPEIVKGFFASVVSNLNSKQCLQVSEGQW